MAVGSTPVGYGVAWVAHSARVGVELEAGDGVAQIVGRYT